MKSPKQVTVGRIVLYVANDNKTTNNGAEILPALVVRTWEDSGYQNDEVNLRIFQDGPEVLWRTSVPHDADKAPGTWHWPEVLAAAAPAEISGPADPVDITIHTDKQNNEGGELTGEKDQVNTGSPTLEQQQGHESQNQQ
jgi:hypothetical protein